MARPAYDVAIIGAGPNGLTAAAYLARAGAGVVLLERRFERGGTFATDDYSTPFQYNQAQFELPLGHELPPYRDLDLESEGVRFVEPAFPFAAGREPGDEELVIGRRGRGLGPELEAMLTAASEAVTPLLYGPPRPNDVVRDEVSARGLEAALGLADSTPRALAEAADDPRAGIIVRHACALAGFFEPAERLGLVGAFCLARRFEPSIVVGGSKNLANALFRVAVREGARAFVSAEVVRVSQRAGAFVLLTATGAEFVARAVISTLDPRATFLDLLSGEGIPPDLGDRARAWRGERAALFTVHIGMRGQAPAPAGDDGTDALVRVFGFSASESVGGRIESALRGELSREFAGHLTVVSAHDPLQASPGPHGPLHTLRAQAIVPSRPVDMRWDAARAPMRSACWNALRASFDRLGEARLLFQFCDSPLDLERRFATTRGGSIRQGALIAEQTLTGRPHPACANGRTPIEGLYLGGGSVHPGVPGTLAAGMNAAALVAQDLGR